MFLCFFSPPMKFLCILIAMQDDAGLIEHFPRCQAVKPSFLVFSPFPFVVVDTRIVYPIVLSDRD